MAVLIIVHSMQCTCSLFPVDLVINIKFHTVIGFASRFMGLFFIIQLSTVLFLKRKLC